MIKLTPAQKDLFCRELHEKGFIILTSAADDRVAKNLHKLGLGVFVDFRDQYSCRRRSEYINHFRPNPKGLMLIQNIKRSARLSRVFKRGPKA